VDSQIVSVVISGNLTMRCYVLRPVSDAIQTRDREIIGG
jgi:hypothetical protein